MWWTSWQHRSNIPAEELGPAREPLPASARPGARFTIGGGIPQRVVNRQPGRSYLLDGQPIVRTAVEPQAQILRDVSNFAQPEAIRHLDGDLSLPDTAPRPSVGTGTRPGIIDVLVGIVNAAVNKASYGLVRSAITLPARSAPAPAPAVDPNSGDVGADYNPDFGPMIGGVSSGEIKASDLTGDRIGDAEFAGPEQSVAEHGFGSGAGEKI